MKNLKRKVCSLFLLGAVLFSLNGCGSNLKKEPIGDISLIINKEYAIEYNKDESGEKEILNTIVEIYEDDENVFQVVARALKSNKISYDTTGSGDTLYIKAIDNLYEFDCGEESGWMYKINGEFPLNGMGKEPISDGDEIEIIYYTSYDIFN